VFGSLGRDTPDSRANFAPAGTVLPCRLGGPVTETVGRSPQKVSEVKGGKRSSGLVWHACSRLTQAAFNQVVGEHLGI
jgi:hypothetical protein